MYQTNTSLSLKRTRKYTDFNFHTLTFIGHSVRRVEPLLRFFPIVQNIGILSPC